VHIHVPAGAMPKDGPSAGIAMFTALASLFTRRAVRRDTAMTGEITLRGQVLPIGGLKQKVLGAHRAGIRRIILPKPNVRDLEDIPAEVRRDLTFLPVEDLDQVLEAAFVPRGKGKRKTSGRGRSRPAAGRPAPEAERQDRAALPSPSNRSRG